MSDSSAVVQLALRAALSGWAVSEVRGNQARVLPAPDLDTLSAHLAAVDPAWSLTWACESAAPFVVRARLTLGGAVREGLSSAQRLEDAKKLALADVFRYFGVYSALEAPWVDYDPEEGANTSELGAGDFGAEAQTARPVTPLPSAPKDPQMESARAHIDTLMEQLRQGGKGGEAIKLLMRGYGETVEESRAIYKELQALQRR
ncbi:single-stranded DNA-binding protein [Deinococcus psychrotolerans]|uniref:Single-stranded DNA-binding protein n=1 Tax=Deinococcus psychrotolerans TaxID=2489213 RepID=A0A3G8YFD2_9DEIO|nr:single-stranded DNA-binding protein [Deinococcus psychrotolerans]AZI42887.1 single-stranded DNA-binding protein [Deinococcus psychrotolerans]